MNQATNRVPCAMPAISSQGIAEGAMESPSFFRDLATRFDALRQSHDVREQLQATYVETTQRHVAVSMGWEARHAIVRGDDDMLRRFAIEAAHAANLHLTDVTKWSSYTISGGPSDNSTMRSLHNHWSALAIQGAYAATTGPLADDPCDVWLDLLRTRGSYFTTHDISASVDEEHFEESGGCIDRLCTASIEMCVILEGEASVAVALGRNSVPKRDAADSAPLVVDLQNAFDLIGHAIERYRIECGFSKRDLAAASGFSESTVKRHIAGTMRPSAENVGTYAGLFSRKLEKDISVDDLLRVALATPSPQPRR